MMHGYRDMYCFQTNSIQGYFIRKIAYRYDKVCNNIILHEFITKINKYLS